MSTTDTELVAKLATAATANALAMDHLIRLRREAKGFARDVGDPELADTYVVTAVLQTLAMAEDARHDGHGSSSQAGLQSFAAGNLEAGS